MATREIVESFWRAQPFQWLWLDLCGSNPGDCFHTINLGNHCRWLFQKKGGAEAFERVLGEAALRFGWEIHPYVVMGTHFHMAVPMGEPILSERIKWLQGTWISRYNNLRRIVGRPLQGR